uniref:Leucine-rich repeat and coiled-coil domain-containing protein 1 n=1 Tax=Oncorhynchus mykiss TaxID=8022 RepID=A0A8K9XD91_ONCMY
MIQAASSSGAAAKQQQQIANVTSLNLHCNRILKVEGLTTAWHLRHLDLSSNHISRIEGLNSLASLRTLNLSCNLITKVEGLNGLVNLIRLNLAYNQISDLTGLLYLHGAEYKLRHLHLHSNRLDSINQLLQCMLGLENLTDVTLSVEGAGNSVCSLPGYRELVLQSLPQVSSLDGVDRLGNPAPLGEDSPIDIPGLENYVDFLLSSDTSANELVNINHNQMIFYIMYAKRVVPHLKTDVGLYHPLSVMGNPFCRPADQFPQIHFFQKVNKKKIYIYNNLLKSDLVSQLPCLFPPPRLKELLLKERSERSGLQARVEELDERCQSSALQLEQVLQREEQHKRALRSLEDSTSHSEARKARRQAEEVELLQELENKASALMRELEIQRASLRQHKDKLRQLHELLASREQVHRKELEGRLMPGGAEFREVVAKEVAGVEQRHAQSRAGLEDRLAQASQQYTALEDEFRMALTIEAARFTEVEQGCTRLSAELSEVKAALSQTQQRERQAGGLVQELTAMVKEQKSRITELSKSKRDAVTELKGRVRSLEAGAEEDRRLQLQLELVKKDKARLLSQLTAQESVIDGLRAERRIWGQELAQQGASLSQDRGRLEARIEVLAAELESQKKQNERDNDALRIKVKVIDDQTETIRKLKEGLQERDEQGRRQREESLQAQRRLQQQLEESSATSQDLGDTVQQLSLRKEQLKQQLEDKEMELDEVKAAFSVSNKKWQDKADLLTRLESQVKRMKEGFDSKESLLLEERDKASQAAVVEKLHSMDDAFRRQLESLQASHQTELLRLANDKQKRIEQSNQKVFQVEEEMRQLLEETETEKKTMEEKMRRLTSVLKDF